MSCSTTPKAAALYSVQIFGDNASPPSFPAPRI